MTRAGGLRIAMLGTRGVPASYSGFETCVEELGSRLAARGHDVTVYCRVPHIKLLEAMAAGTCVVVNDTPENMETIGESGFSYSGGVGAAGLRPVLERLLKDPALVTQQAERGRERVRTNYSWDSVADAYEQLFRQFAAEAT
jgi:glycosyltransferase involved in cell wall biosynthesis